MRKQFRLAFDEISEVLLQHRGNAGMQLLSPSAQERRVGSVLHQGVLEQIRGMRSGAATKQQTRITKLTQPG